MSNMQPNMGRVMSYNAATGSGVLSINGQRTPFNLDNWKSDVVPVAGSVFRVVNDQEGALLVELVSDADVLKQKLNDVGGRITTEGVSSVRHAAGALIQAAGLPVLLGYAAFAFATGELSFVSTKALGTSMGSTLHDFLIQIKALSGSGFGSAMLWVAYLSLVVPLMWKERRAYLSYFVPLLTMLVALFDLWSMVSDLKKQMSQFVGANNVPALSDVISFGAGFYGAILAALFLAFLGISKFRSHD
jgi:hypothetical protein